MGTHTVCVFSVGASPVQIKHPRTVNNATNSLAKQGCRGPTSRALYHCTNKFPTILILGNWGVTNCTKGGMEGETGPETMVLTFHNRWDSNRWDRAFV